MTPALNEYLTQDLPKLLAATTFDVGETVRLQLVVPGHIELRTHYELTKQGVTATPGLGEVSSHVTLAIQLPELEQLRQGSLDLNEALVLGRIQLFGDAATAQRLGRMLSGSNVWGGASR